MRQQDVNTEDVKWGTEEKWVIGKWVAETYPETEKMDVRVVEVVLLQCSHLQLPQQTWALRKVAIDR
jgi:hypothetical protein